MNRPVNHLRNILCVSEKLRGISIGGNFTVKFIGDKLKVNT